MPKKHESSSGNKKHKSDKREQKFKKKLGKKLLKSINRGASRVQKKITLCKENGVSIDFVQKKSNASALHCATILGRVDIAELLLDNGAMIDIRDIDGNTPLIYAVKHQYPDLAKLYVSRGANLHSTNQKGESPLSLGVTDMLHLKEIVNVESDEEDGWRHEEEERDFDWAEHLDAEYSDNEDSQYRNWRDIEQEYKEMEDDSWMDKIAAQARSKFSRTLPQRQEKEQKQQEQSEREREYRRLLEDEMQKDKEWRERVMSAAALNNSEKDEENWLKFEDLKLQVITKKDVPWPTGPAINILGIKESLPFTAKKQLVRAGLLRWHPDKFMQKFGSRLLEEDKANILEKVKEVSQSINHYAEKALVVKPQ